MRVRYIVVRVELPDNDPKAFPMVRTRIRRFKGQAQRWGKLFDAPNQVVTHWEVNEQVPVAVSEEGRGDAGDGGEPPAVGGMPPQ